jgi:hypothetical protein
MSEPIKLCRDCANVRRMMPEDPPNWWRCSVATWTDPVSGDTKDANCGLERQGVGASCGPEGRNWRAREGGAK